MSEAEGQKASGDAPKRPVMAQKGPYEVTLKAGERVLWCACGLSKKQPFCDTSHKGTGLRPVAYVAAADETLWFCGCKQTGTRPMCDDTHLSL